jgi:hypothetical protein
VTSVDPIIRRLARKYGLDERAVIAVALGEGGLTPGWHVGDRAGGGSYGPFQLYAQGALPQRFRGKPKLANRWAWSPQGIDYALRQMVKAGAGGLSGPQAVETIIRKFERPADPDKSVRLALSRYGGIQAGGAAPPEGPVRAQAIPSPSPGAAPGPDIGTLRSNVLTTLLAERRSGQSGRSGSLAALAQLQQALAQPRPTEPRDVGQGDYERAELQPGMSWQGTHNTDNLWESKTARDFMAKPGTTVGAPEDGVIIRHGSAQGGKALYFLGKSGRTYWLGHIDSMLPPGTRVRAGQTIARVSADHPAPHLHIDYQEPRR